MSTSSRVVAFLSAFLLALSSLAPLPSTPRAVAADTTLSFSGPALAIPDIDSPVESTANVTGVNGPISRVTVGLHISHTDVSDLQVFLVAPNGEELVLADEVVGFSDSNFGTGCGTTQRTRFADDANDFLEDDDAPYVGVYLPDGTGDIETFAELVATLTAGQANGAWKLRIVDGTPEDAGTLECWTLEIAADINQAPVLSNVSAQAGGNPRSVRVTGTISDADAVDGFTLTVDWGAGAPTQLPVLISGPAPKSFDVTNTYDSVGPKSITVTVTDSAGNSDSESVQYTIGSPGVIRINSVVSPCFSGSCSEGESGDLLVQIFREGDKEGAVSVQLDVSGTAIEGQTGDYFIRAIEGAGTRLAPPLIITFDDGEPGGTQLVERFIRINDDTLDEPNETITLTLSNPTGGVEIHPTGGTVSVTIEDNDLPPSPGELGLFKTCGGCSEGVLAIVNVNRDGGAGGEITVDFAVGGGTATEGATGDYFRVDDPSDPNAARQAPTGTLTLKNNQTQKQLYFRIVNDTAHDPGETFAITLSNPSGGATVNPAHTSAIVTIDDNDPAPPALSLSNVQVTPEINEGGAVTLRGNVQGATGPVTLRINWGPGEGASQVVNLSAGETSFSVEHQYLDDNPTNTSSDVYSIQVTASDSAGASAITNVSTTVRNVDPQLTNVTFTRKDGSAVNDVYVLRGSLVDPGTRDTFTLNIDWDDEDQVVSLPAGTTTIEVEHTYTAPGNRDIEVEILDDDRGDNRYLGIPPITVGCDKLNPTIAVRLQKGDKQKRTFDVSVEPKKAKKTETPCSLRSVKIKWGDGNEVSHDVRQASHIASHTYAANPARVKYTIIVEWTDSGGHTGVFTHAKGVTPR